MKSTRRKGDITFGTKDLLADDEFDPKLGKERITLFVDQQVVNAFRELARANGEKYQALMRKSLKDLVFGDSLESRVSRLEEKVFKQKA